MKKVAQPIDYEQVSGNQTTKSYYSAYAQLYSKFRQNIGICKDFAGNRVNELGNVPGEDL